MCFSLPLHGPLYLSNPLMTTVCVIIPVTSNIAFWATLRVVDEPAITEKHHTDHTTSEFGREAKDPQTAHRPADLEKAICPPLRTGKLYRNKSIHHALPEHTGRQPGAVRHLAPRPFLVGVIAEFGEPLRIGP